MRRKTTFNRFKINNFLYYPELDEFYELVEFADEDISNIQFLQEEFAKGILLDEIVINREASTSKKNKDSSISTLSLTNPFLIFGAATLEKSTTRFYLGTARPQASVKFLDANFYGNGRVFLNGSHVGNKLGKVGFGAGLFMDSYGVKNYYLSNSPNSYKVSAVKAGLNTGMGLWGMLGGPYGFGVSLLYSGMDNIYPRGVEGYINDGAAFQKEMDKVSAAGPYNIYLIPRGELNRYDKKNL